MNSLFGWLLKPVFKLPQPKGWQAPNLSTSNLPLSPAERGEKFYINPRFTFKFARVFDQ